jgi:hypothetical protein
MNLTAKIEFSIDSLEGNPQKIEFHYDLIDTHPIIDLLTYNVSKLTSLLKHYLQLYSFYCSLILDWFQPR